MISVTYATQQSPAPSQSRFRCTWTEPHNKYPVFDSRLCWNIFYHYSFVHLCISDHILRNRCARRRQHVTLRNTVINVTLKPCSHRQSRRYFLWLIYIDGDKLGYVLGLGFGFQNQWLVILYYAKHVHIAQTPYFCTGQESKSESVPESVSGNVNEPLPIKMG